MTVIEVYDSVPMATDGWHVFKKQNGITRGSCPPKGEFRYDKQYESYVFKHHYDYFPNGKWNHFENAKATFNELTDRNIYAHYKELMEERCNCLAAGLNNEVVISMNHHIVVKLVGHYPKTIRPDMLNCILGEARH